MPPAPGRIGAGNLARGRYQRRPKSREDPTPVSRENSICARATGVSRDRRPRTQWIGTALAAESKTLKALF